MLLESLTVGPLQVNCYLIADEVSRRAIIVDPGGDAARIIARIRALNLTPERIVNTHCHFDHVLAVDALKAEFGIPFWVHRESLPLLEISAAEAFQLIGYRIERSPQADYFYEAGENVAVGGLELTVHHTPGHSPDGCTFLGEGICISGDVLFAGSVGRWDLPGADFETLMRSIQRVYLDLPDETPVYPGHGPATTMGQERRYNPFVRALTAGIDPATLFG